VGGLLVVLEGRPVAEDGRAERAGDDLSGVCRSNVTIETGATRELGIALVTLEIFLLSVFKDFLFLRHCRWGNSN
jgi:hypothetical protein